MGWSYGSAIHFDKHGKVDRRAEVLDLIGHSRSNLVKLAQSGSTFYAVMENPEKKHWVLKLLTSVENRDFGYKDIELSRGDIGGVPDSILKAFKPYDDATRAWLADNLEYNKKKNTSVKVEVGDIFSLKAPYKISWGDGYAIEKDTEFKVRVGVLNPWASRKTKTFVVLRHNVYNENEKAYYQSAYRIQGGTFKAAEKTKLTDPEITVN